MSASQNGEGPGAFTGLRIACGMAQGLAFSRQLPVVGIPTLLASGRRIKYFATPVVRASVSVWLNTKTPTRSRSPAVCRPRKRSRKVVRVYSNRF